MPAVGRLATSEAPHRSGRGERVCVGDEEGVTKVLSCLAGMAGTVLMLAASTSAGRSSMIENLTYSVLCCLTPFGILGLLLASAGGLICYFGRTR